MANPFQSVEVLKLPRTFFKLPKRVLSTYNYGKVYPIDIQDMIPGDTVKTRLACSIESLPLSAPNKTPVKADFFQFFVPYRLLDENFPKFMAGNEDGTDFVYELPTFQYIVGPDEKDFNSSIWSYFGFSAFSDSTGFQNLPSGVKLYDSPENVDNVVKPIKYPLFAYNLIWNLFFRDETFQEEVDVLNTQKLLYSCWKKDYFTSALKSQCKPNIPPALSLSGILPVRFSGSTEYAISPTGSNNLILEASNTSSSFLFGSPTGGSSISGSVSLDDAGTFGVDEMRLVFQIQKWLERNSRCGNRYNEFLLAHYGQSNGDARLQRPEFLGKISVPVFTTEVLQTSETATSPLGTRGANQNAVGSNSFAKTHISEFGVLITLMTIRPDAEYSQGTNRQWLKQTRFDFYSGEFAYLSERPIYEGELFGQINRSGSGPNQVLPTLRKVPLGFQEIWSEYRYLPTTYSGLLRSELNNWHMGRLFTSTPTMSDEFLKCYPSHSPYADTDPDSDCFVIETILTYNMFRPIPRHSTPGLIDHF